MKEIVNVDSKEKEFQMLGDVNYGQLSDDISKLSAYQKKILVADLERVFTGKKITDKEMMEGLGMNRQNLYSVRANETYARTYLAILKANVQANLGEVVGHLMRNSEGGDTSASRTLLQFAEAITTVTKNLNVNVDNRRVETVEESVDSLIIRLGELGVSTEAFVQRYIDLKNAGRF